jgi:tRNA/rRNA methyltransferase
MSEGTDQPIIVLVRPQLGENIGKAARAMLNFGLTELRLVEPRDGWPSPAAGRAASGADEVLAGAQVYPNVAAAVADCAHVFATTVRKRGVTKPVLTPEEAAREVIANHGRSAILFGPERSGLETEEVALANAIVTVPINPEFGSLNLAQAVILLTYEWSRGSGLAQPPVKPGEEPATHGEVDGLIGQLDDALLAKGYFHPPSRTQATRNTIRTIFTKTGWSSREVKAVRGILRALVGPARRREGRSAPSRRSARDPRPRCPGPGRGALPPGGAGIPPAPAPRRTRSPAPTDGRGSTPPSDSRCARPRGRRTSRR